MPSIDRIWYALAASGIFLNGCGDFVSGGGIGELISGPTAGSTQAATSSSVSVTSSPGGSYHSLRTSEIRGTPVRNDRLVVPKNPFPANPHSRLPSPSDFETQEFKNGIGLDLINAQYAYVMGADGEGIVVAVIDSGVDLDHSDLAANISPLSTNIAEPGEPVHPIGTRHGTFVAGVIAARKNDVGMHGVAYNATILALQGCPSTGNCGFHRSISADAVDYAVANGAQVINMSFRAHSDAIFEEALEKAARAGVIFVSATGNDGKSTVPYYPTMPDGDPSMLGLMIRVGAVDTRGRITYFSTRCGDLADICMVAPGWPGYSTVPNDEHGYAGGTSVAAPYVSGAAALLLQLFHNLSPQQVVQILLTTATDLGAPGVDSVYGHGLVNLRSALQPIGILTVPLSDSTAGGDSPVIYSSLVLGPAFGDALESVTALSRAIGVDDFNRTYRIDLNQHVGRIERSFGLQALLSPSDTLFVTSRLPSGASVSLGLDKRDRTGFGLQETRVPGYEIGSMLLSSDLSNASSVSFGYGLTALQQFDLSPEARDRSLFWSSSEVLSPQHGLLGEGSGAAFETALAENTRLSLGWFQQTGDALWDADGSGLGQIAIEHGFSYGGNIRFGASYLSEDAQFLGSRSTGAFGANSAAQSLFVTLSGTVPITKQIELIGSVTHGSTQIDQRSAALLNDWSTVSSAAFGAGVVARDVFADEDRLGVLVGQPLRVYDATARATVPTAVRKDNTVVYDVSRVDATPSGREIDFQLAYETGLLPGARLSNWLMMRLNPGHDRNAETDFAVGAKLSIAF